jgi:hypothetical protein
MCDASFEYTFEYQGNKNKLVYTPLTDKCYLNMTQGMHLGYGGNPYGPAGTGKTESVKALGNDMGRQVCPSSPFITLCSLCAHSHISIRSFSSLYFVCFTLVNNMTSAPLSLSSPLTIHSLSVYSHLFVPPPSHTHTHSLSHTHTYHTHTHTLTHTPGARVQLRRRHRRQVHGAHLHRPRQVRRVGVLR